MRTARSTANGQATIFGRKYIPLKTFEAYWFFEDPAVTETDLKNIRPFSEEYASKYWLDNIYGERHLMIVDTALCLLCHAQNSGERERLCDNWICSLKKAGYNCLDDWNNDNIRGLSDFLSGCADLPDNEPVVFFWYKESGIETTWGVFLRNWINFLYDDESPVLICPRTGFSVRFVSDGTLYWGYR
jgi:hypothetical protein